MTDSPLWQTAKLGCGRCTELERRLRLAYQRAAYCEMQWHVCSKMALVAERKLRLIDAVLRKEGA